MNENRLKVSNPERISRILQRIAQAGLQVLVRTSNASGTAIKGRATNFSTVAPLAGLRISNISERGLAILGGEQVVQVEFIMMSTKVIFHSRVIGLDSISIVVAQPLSLISIERRKNSRFATTQDFSAYMTLSGWEPKESEPLSPPFFTHQGNLGKLITIADVSQNGLCGIMRFPGPMQTLKRGVIDDRVNIHLPMQKPFTLSLEIRWTKRIKERVENADGSIKQMRSYRFGAEFLNPSQDVQLFIRQFIQQLTQQGAV